MPTLSYIVTLTGGSIPMSASGVRTGDGLDSREVTIPAAKAVTAWVKTDANTAACNLPGGHGYTDGKFDVFWTGGYRYDVDGTIVTNALSLDGGSGTDFPASADTTVVVCKHVQCNVSIDGDALVLLGEQALIAEVNGASTRVHIHYEDGAGDSIANRLLTANDAPTITDVYGGATNGYTGDPITVAYATNANTSYSATLRILPLVDSTPG